MEYHKALALVNGAAVEHDHLWRDQPDSYWLMRLMEEVGELAAALADDHDHHPVHELVQISSIALNWMTLPHLGMPESDFYKLPPAGGGRNRR